MQTLQSIEQQIAAASLPPVHRWHPERSGSIDIEIRRDGSWWHEGTRIERDRLVKLFSRIIRLEPDGRYCLVTPHERLFISVELVPFLVVELDVFGEGSDAVLAFRTSTDERVIADRDHVLSLRSDNLGDSLPILVVRDGLEALLSRSVYYQVMQRVIELDNGYGVWSGGVFHRLAETGTVAAHD